MFAMSLLSLLGCPEGDVRQPTDTDENQDTASPDDTGDDPTPMTGCRATPEPADRDRALIVSHPYAADGGQADQWEVLRVAEDGDISPTGDTFEMGRGYMGTVRFTPDGSLGVAVQNDGTLGIFTVDGSLGVEVVEPAWNDDDAFYASDVWIDPSGERLWVVDGNWANNGGGLYEVALDCDTGAPTVGERLLESKLAAHLLGSTASKLLLVAREAGDAGEGHLFPVDASSGDVAGGLTLFSDPDVILAGAALTADGYALVGDNSEFASVDNSVAVARVQGLSRTGAIDVQDPVALWASPFADGVLVLSGYGDDLIALERDDGSPVGFVRGDTVASELPGAVDGLTRGTLEGHAFVAEVSGVRRVSFDGSGGLHDHGRYDMDGMDGIPGALGIQP